MVMFRYIDFDNKAQAINCQIANNKGELCIISPPDILAHSTGKTIPTSINLFASGGLHYYLPSSRGVGTTVTPFKNFTMTLFENGNISMMNEDVESAIRPSRILIDTQNKTVKYPLIEKFETRYLVTHLKQWVMPSYTDLMNEVKLLVDHRTFCGEGFNLTSLVDVGYHDSIERWKRLNEQIVERL